MLITSRANPRVKALRALRERSERAATGLFLAEGARVIRAAIDAGAEIETLIVAPSRITNDDIAVFEAGSAVARDILELDASAFDAITFREEPAAVAATVRRRHDTLPATATTERSWLLVNEIQHPGNVGTLIRNSDAAGGAGLILTGASADPYHPIAVRGSLGAIFSQKVVETSEDEVAAWTGTYECQVVGASPAGSADYRDVRFKPPVVLAMGGEREGLTAAQRALCGEIVRIPMAGAVESLNLSVAAALLLYEVYRQTATAG